MFSAKLYVKYPQSTFTEEKDQSGYLGTYSVIIPCNIFRDEALTLSCGGETFEFTNLTIEECTPEHIYGLVMSQFEDASHIE